MKIQYYDFRSASVAQSQAVKIVSEPVLRPDQVADTNAFGLAVEGDAVG